MNLYRSNLIQLLIDFDQYEWAGLRKYIESPFFNTRNDVTRLYYVLKDILFSNRNIDALSVENLLHYLNPDGVENEKSLRYVMSFLFQHTKGYIIASQKEPNSLTEQVGFISVLRTKSKYGLIKKTLAKIDRDSSKNRQVTGQLLYDSYCLNLERHAVKQQSNRNDSSFLIAASKELDQLFIIEKLRLYANFLVHQSMTQLEYEDPFVKYILKHVLDHKQEQTLLVRLYASACLSFEFLEDESHFQLFKTQLLTEGKNLTIDQNKECITIAVNFCIRKLNSGNRKYVGEVFELYQVGLERRAFFENGYLSRFTYKNISTAALGMGKVEWAENFLHTYKDDLDPRYKEDAFRYNMAILQYKNQQYDRTLEILRDVEFEDLFFNLNARTMLLKILFEKELWSSLDSHLDSFKAFLYRHNELGYQKNHYLNLVKYSRKLLRSYNFNASKKIELKRSILAESDLAEKAWLLEKIK